MTLSEYLDDWGIRYAAQMLTNYCRAHLRVRVKIKL